MNRREVIAGATVVLTGGIAGCGGDGGEPTDGTTTGEDGAAGSGYSGTGTEKYEGTWSSSELSGTWEFTVDWETGEITGSTAGDVTVDISGTAEAGAIEAEGEAAMGTVSWSGTFSADGSSVSGEWSGLGDAGTWSGSRVTEDGTPGETPETTEGTPEKTAEPTEETTEETTEEPAVRYGGLISYESNYTVEVEYSDPNSDEAGTGTARYHGDDYYLWIDSDSLDGIYEVYHVDDDTYVVIDGQTCFLNPGASVRPDSDVESQSDAEAQGSKPDADLRPSGTTQIDGETVYVFEVTGQDIEGSLTFYVSASTGYLRRVEGIWGTATFHSWGETEPISAPDIDCQKFGT